MKLISALTAGTLLAAGGVVAVAGPATSAPALTTRCSGTADGITITGDLVVPSGQSCDLTGVTVTGSTRVAAGGDLVAEGSSFGGGVVVAEDAFFGAVDSSVAGRVTSRQGFGVTLEGSQAQSVVTRAVEGSDVLGVTWLEDGSTVSGAVDARAGELLISSSTVGGPVRGIGTTYTDVVDSTLRGSLDVVDNAEGGVFCESEVYGDAIYTGNMSLLQLGADGPVEVCDGASFWGGDVTISDNMAEITLDQNIVAGNLSGEGNDPAPTVGEGNRVRGELSGQFGAPAEEDATVGVQALEASVARMAATTEGAEEATVESVVERTEATRALLDERVAVAEAAAAAEGPIA
ncbi:hypothetical protein [uncultured Pseudokineococcus sp.]|uniref:hypothetical protein n=1 Tax=uncultured Pseudokineococcus sp. TaxID=1642928 RepID=UPI0026293950|nr:hypothetical protein [uncultured Pseudokineococcus sp.]